MRRLGQGSLQMLGGQAAAEMQLDDKLLCIVNAAGPLTLTHG